MSVLALPATLTSTLLGPELGRMVAAAAVRAASSA